MRHLVLFLGLQLTAVSTLAAAQKAPALVTCTATVSRTICEAVSADLETRQSLPALRSVQFVIADPRAFQQEQERAGDYVFAGIVNKNHPGSLTPMLHSSFDSGIIFEVTDASILKCPDKVVISTEMFRDNSTSKSGNGFDLGLTQTYITFIQGFLEGCLGGRQAR